MSDNRTEVAPAQRPIPASSQRTHAPGGAGAPHARLDASDESLIEAHRAGDGGALPELLTRHQGRLFAICLRMVGDHDRARDLVQDAMVKLIEGLPGFDGRASFTTWMTRVTMNMCLSNLRRERLRRHASLDAPAGAASDGYAPPVWATREQPREPGAEDSVQQAEELQRLELAMASLEPEQRAILVLRDVRGLDYRQIADVIEVAVGTVKSRLFRARAALREAMQRLEDSGR